MNETVQILNALSLEIHAAEQLLGLIFKLKEYRARLDALGIQDLSGATVFPGDLDHLNRTKILRALGAMDVLDAALLTPTAIEGVTIPPIKAIVDVIR